MQYNRKRLCEVRNARYSETVILHEAAKNRHGILATWLDRSDSDGLKEMKNLRCKPAEGYSMIQHHADVLTLFLPGVLGMSQMCHVPYRYASTGTVQYIFDFTVTVFSHKRRCPNSKTY
jgi:hypothetical protein